MEIDMYLYKYLKYKYKYLLLKDEIKGGKSPNNIISRLKSLKIPDKEISNTSIELLKLAIKEIPVFGNMYGIIDVALMMNTFYPEFMNIIKSSNSLTVLTKIRLKIDDNEGPDFVKKQFEELWSSDKLTKQNKVFLCNNINILMNYLTKIIRKFIASIPEIGPVISAALLKIDLLTFNKVSFMFNRLNKNYKKYIYTPRKIVDDFNKTIITGINKKYSKYNINIKPLKKHKEIKKGGVLGVNTSKIIDSASTAIQVGNIIGINKKLSDVNNTIINKISPGIFNFVDFIEKIFPLIFTLPLIKEQTLNEKLC